MTAAGAIPELIDRARRLDTAAVAALVSIFEDQRAEACLRRAAVQDAIDRVSAPRRPAVIGFTGGPGSGKSSLLARLARELLANDNRLSLAIVAVDPSSPTSGGALLGDRTRMRMEGADARLFFRSQASANALGGLAPATFPVCRLLSAFYDGILLETVGVGQSELDVRALADHVLLVIAPLGGDEVQLLKAGIVEIPDGFVVNKCDEPSATRTFFQLRASLWLARPADGDALPVHRTSARNGEGIAELARDLLARLRAGSERSLADRSPYFFARWVCEEWGRAGAGFLERELGGASAHLAAAGGFDLAQSGFSRIFLAHLREKPEEHGHGV